MNTTVTRIAAVLGALALSVPAAGTALAKDDSRAEVRVSGDCSARTDWKLKAKERDGGLEVEFEVDSNRTGQKWSYRMSRAGTDFATGKATTRGRSGSFSVERRTARGAAGTDTITARATRKASGEVCLATLSI